MRKHSRKMLIVLALLVGSAPFMLASASPTSPQTLCYRKRTIRVAQILVRYYLAAGAKRGACTVSGPR